MSQIKQYNYCLDFIKGIACICIVFMHCEFPGYLGVAVQAVSRFGVPIFFMISGYYSYRNFLQREGNTRKIRHIALITLGAVGFYILFESLQVLLFNKTINEIGVNEIKSLLIFNAPFFIVGQLWFLFALLYVYIAFAILCKLRSIKLAFVIMACTFIAYYCLAQGCHLFGIRIPNHFYRNWLIEGLPYFLLGIFINRYKDKLNLKNGLLLSIIFICTSLCLLERWILGRDFGVNIMTLPQVSAIFLFAINNPLKNSGAIQLLGKNHSMMIYILHPFVWHSLAHLYNRFGINESMLMNYLLPILVVIITIMLSLSFNKIKGFFIDNFSKKKNIILENA